LTSHAAEEVHKDKWVQQLHAQIQTFLTENIAWLGLPESHAEPKMMDYACGSGVVSRVR
jgi:hypothetical protein